MNFSNTGGSFVAPERVYHLTLFMVDNVLDFLNAVMFVYFVYWKVFVFVLPCT